MSHRNGYCPEREQPRFKTVDQALVLIHRGPESLPYHILDISEGGLSFRYLGQRLKRSDIREISLFHKQQLVASHLPIESVSDCRLDEGSVPVRRGSVRFGQLSRRQKQQIDAFIQRFADRPLSCVPETKPDQP